MGSYEIIWAILVGGLAGVLSLMVLKFKKADRQQIRAKLGIYCSLISGLILFLMDFTNLKSEIISSFSPQYRVLSSFQREVLKLHDHPQLKGLMEKRNPQGDLNWYLQALKGVRRLPPDQLRAWVDLKLKLAGKNSSLCAEQWSGKYHEENLLKALEELNERDFQSWLFLTMTALQLELRDENNFSFRESDFQEGLRQLIKGLSQKDRLRFKANWEKGAELDDQEACWSNLRLLEQLGKMETTILDGFLRSLKSF